MGKKVTIIGGGSSSFVPVLLRRLMTNQVLGDSTVTLMDIDQGRLDTMQRLGEKLIEGEGSALRVESTTDQREALAGADFVIAAISVGGFDAWANDLEIPARYGIVMHVADSVGPGGIMRAMRNIPVLAEVARNVAEVAPDAYVFNYTNPAPTEAMAMRRAAPSVKTFALCSCTGHPGSAEWLAGEAGVAADQIAMPPVVGGINHCASVQQLRLVDGTDAMPLVRENATNPVVQWALDTYGVLPYCWSHWVEHFPQLQRLDQEYAGTAQGVKMKYGITTHDMAYEKARVAELEALAATLDGARLRGGDAGRPAGGRRGLGHRGDRHHGVDRRQPEPRVRGQRAQRRRDPQPAARRDRRGERGGQRLRHPTDRPSSRCTPRWRRTCRAGSRSSSTWCKRRSAGRRRICCGRSCSIRTPART